LKYYDTEDFIIDFDDVWKCEKIIGKYFTINTDYKILLPQKRGFPTIGGKP
jgi:hypothetical protein